MKNLGKVLKSSFLAKMAFVATVLAVLIASASCKHDKGGDNPKPNPKVEEVTLTFKMGANVTKVEPASVKVEKGKAIKLSELKAKITKMEFAKDYEFSKLCVGAENGAEIKEDGTFKPVANTDVYVVAKSKNDPPGPGPGPAPEDVALTKVMVDGGNIAVADAMDAGSKSKAEVSLEFTTNPADATLSFEPALKDYNATSKSGTWALNSGDNNIKITVKKDSKTKEYTLKVKRVSEDEPLLTELKVDGVSISPKEEPEVMTVDPTTKDKVKVEYAANEGSAVTTTPSIASGSEWTLAYGENTLKFVVTKGSKTRNYTLKITRPVELKTVKVDGNSITPIADEMTATETEKEEVPVEFTTDPADATLTFDPTNAIKDYDATSKSGKWALALGLNTLKVKVVKDTGSKEYTLKITRNVAAPKLTSLVVGPHTKDVAGIVTSDVGTIEVPVPTQFDGVEYAVTTTTDTAGATVTWDPALENDKIKFGNVKYISDLTKEYTVTVAKDGKESSYKVKAMMMTNAAGFFAGRIKGKDTSADLENIRKILKHEDVTLTQAGAESLVIFVSQLAQWQVAYYNRENVKVDLPPGTRFKGMGRKSLTLPLAKGKSLLKDEELADNEIEVVVSNSEWEEVSEGGVVKYYKAKEPWLATEVFKFKIAQSNEKADAFIEKVLLNDKNIADEEKDPEAFTNLFATELAEFDSGKKANVAIELSKAVQKVTINSTDINEADLVASGDNFIAKKEGIVVNEDGTTPTLVTIVVTPKAEDVAYGETTMKFNLTYKVPPKFYPRSYTINEVGYYSLPATFREALVEDGNPSYTVKANHLGMNLTFAKKPKKVEMDIAGTKTTAEGTAIVENKTKYGTTYSVNIGGTVNNNEQQVTLTFTPDDEGAFSEGQWKFKVTGTNDKPAIDPTFTKIGKDENLTEAFLNAIKTGTAPDNEYQLPGTTAEAELVISLTEYTHDFLLDKIEMTVDDANVEITDENFKLNKGFFSSGWVLKEKINGITAAGKEVKIKFAAKSGVADDVTWTFKLKTGGELPLVPDGKVSLGIAGYGGSGTPFTEEFVAGLATPNNPPTIELYGKDVKVFFRTYYDEYLKEASFKIDDKEAATATASESGYAVQAEHIFEGVSKDGEHTIVAKFEPTSADYKGREYKFKVKILDDLPMPEKYIFGLDGKIRPNEYKATLDKDFATLIFQSSEDLVAEVKMGKEGSTEVVEVKALVDGYGRPFWQATKDIDGLQTNLDSNILHDKWVIEVKPKDDTKYASVKCTFNLKGKDIDANNAAFVESSGSPKVYAKVEWKDGIPTDKRYLDDYGAKAVNFTAYTMSKTSTVKGKKVHALKNTDMMGETEVAFNREGTTREVKGKVEAYTDKPSRMKVWCIGADGTTLDKAKGVYNININPIPLYWSYKKIASAEDGDAAYAAIEVKRSKIKKNKVYMLFAPWKEDFGFVVDTNAVEEKQAKIEKIGSLGRYQDVFRTSLDVEGMNANDTKPIKFRIVHKESNTEAIVYKVMVKVVD